MKLNQRGLLVVISGPSGVGKGTVRKALFSLKNHDLVYSVSMTTRNPRPGEVDGVDYYFVDKETFLKRIEDNKFLEWAEFVGQYYGTPRDKVEEQLEKGKEVVLEIEVNENDIVEEKKDKSVAKKIKIIRNHHWSFIFSLFLFNVINVVIKPTDK